MLDSFGLKLQQIFNKEKVKLDFYRCLELCEIDIKENSVPMVICRTDDEKTVVFPKDVDIHIFAIVYQANFTESNESNQIRVCLTIGDMEAVNGIVNAEFAYAKLYYNDDAECYSSDFLYTTYD